MVATWKEGIDSIIDTLTTDWVRANTDNVKPVVIDIASVAPERGKRLDLNRHDYILCYETAHNEEAPEVFYNFVTTRINITVDMRTDKSRGRLQKDQKDVPTHLPSRGRDLC